MINFPTDTTGRASAVVGVPPLVVQSLSRVGGRRFTVEQAGLIIVCAFRHFGDDPAQYVNGGRIVGQLFERGPVRDELHERVDAGMGWSRNRFSPPHVLAALEQQLGLD